MKKLKKFGIVMIAIFFLFGIAGAYNVLTYNPREELEKDLVSIQRDIDRYFSLEETTRIAWQNAANGLESSLTQKKYKTCMLAILKVEDGDEVMPATKQTCPELFLKG